MKQRQSKILLDTNSYLRLAQNIHPINYQSFGKECYTLYPHENLQDELKGSTTLTRKFNWAYTNEYIENRNRSISLSNNEKLNIKQSLEFISNGAQEHGLGTSSVDTKILATAMELDIYFVTDDQDLIFLAGLFDHNKIYTTLDLMKLMLDEAFINEDKVKQIVEQWNYDCDAPAKSIMQNFERIFGFSCPE